MSETESREREDTMKESERIATKAEPLIAAFVDAGNSDFAVICKRLGYRTDNGVLREVWQAAAQATRERIVKGIREKGHHIEATGYLTRNPDCDTCNLADAIEEGEIG